MSTICLRKLMHQLALTLKCWNLGTNRLRVLSICQRPINHLSQPAKICMAWMTEPPLGISMMSVLQSHRHSSVHPPHSTSPPRVTARFHPPPHSSSNKIQNQPKSLLLQLRLLSCRNNSKRNESSMRLRCRICSRRLQKCVT